jgi:hypothetical protein
MPSSRMNDIARIENLIRQAERRLLDLESEKLQLYNEIEHLKK